MICNICKQSLIPEILSTTGRIPLSIAETENHCDFCGMELGLTPEEYMRKTKELHEEVAASIRKLGDS